MVDIHEVGVALGYAPDYHGFIDIGLDLGRFMIVDVDGDAVRIGLYYSGDDEAIVMVEVATVAEAADAVRVLAAAYVPNRTV